MRSLRPQLVRPAMLALLLSGVCGAAAQQAGDPIRAIVGQWDLVGKLISITINADRTVHHSKLGTGDIQHDNADYFRISYRARNLECRYEIKKYSDNELSLTIVEQGTHPVCEFGDVLRRAPGTAPPPEPKAEAPGKAEPGKAVSGVGGKVAAAATSTGTPAPAPLSVFKDCDACPEMVVVPAGAFRMGAPDGEPGRYAREGPVHEVAIAGPFAAGRYAVTRDQFNAFVAATSYRYGESCREKVWIRINGRIQSRWADKGGHSFLSPPGFGQNGRHPVVCVSWNDADAYAKWLSEKTGKAYRLPSEAEREYIARAGTATPYWWGAAVNPMQANYDASLHAGGSGRPAGCAGEGTAPVDCFAPNPWGFFQVHGNVAEWTLDCWNAGYDGAPQDGSALLTGNCARRVLRGGAFYYGYDEIRAAYREWGLLQERYNHVGFRVARDLKR